MKKAFHNLTRSAQIRRNKKRAQENEDPNECSDKPVKRKLLGNPFGVANRLNSSGSAGVLLVSEDKTGCVNDSFNAEILAESEHNMDTVSVVSELSQAGMDSTSSEGDDSSSDEIIKLPDLGFQPKPVSEAECTIGSSVCGLSHNIIGSLAEKDHASHFDDSSGIPDEQFLATDATSEGTETKDAECDPSSLSSNSSGALQMACTEGIKHNRKPVNRLFIGCSDSSLPPSQRVRTFLNKWSVAACRVPGSHLSLLLKGLKLCLPNVLHDLPVDSRAVKQTPRIKVPIIRVEPGEYYYIGFNKQLDFVLSLLPEDVKILKLFLNVDGIKPYNNTELELYPLLMHVAGCPELRHKVFPIAIWCGKKKPENMSEYFAPVKPELIDAINKGYKYKNRLIIIELLGFILDAPAKCMVMAIIWFNGYSACTKCTVWGKSRGRTRVYTDLNCALRTDKDYRDQVDTHFHPPDRESGLEDIPTLDFSSSFVVDPMHLFFPGISKTCLVTWKGGKPLGIGPKQRVALAEAISALIPCLPREFDGKCRDFFAVSFWKSTDFRTFTLYFAAVALIDALKKDKYEHFLKYHVALSILFTPKYCNDPDMRQYARTLLREFAADTPKIYSESFMTHNFHNVIHVVDDVDYFCTKIPNFSIQAISAFPFENFLQYLISLVEGRHLPLQQIANRLAELYKSGEVFQLYQLREDFPPYCAKVHEEGPLPLHCTNPQYEEIVFPHFTLGTQPPDNFCSLISGEIVEIENFVHSVKDNDIVIVGKVYTDLSNFFPSCVRSSINFGIFKGSRLSSRKLFKISKIESKYVRLPYKNEYVFYPLRHTLEHR